MLTGDVAAAATAKVHAIARRLVTSRAPAADRTLFWAYATPVIDEPFAHAAYGAALDELIATRATHLGLSGGLAGIGWVLQHVLDGDAGLTTIDDALLDSLAQCGPDLLEGLAGIGVYFLERDHREGVEAVVAQLARTAIETEDGLTWATPPEVVRAFDAPVYDCGLAHGVPGICAVLARANSPLARDAARWVVANRGPARTAWCYGDPGVALGLWSTLPAVAREILVVRDPDITDASLCHGAAGLAHIYNRCGLAAERMYARAVELPLPENDNFLDGAVGVGLALLAATTDIEPCWDRLLLCQGSST